MIYERRNVQRARGFNDSIYVNDNTLPVSRLPCLSSFLSSFLSLSFPPPPFPLFTRSAAMYLRPRGYERAACLLLHPCSRKWQMKLCASLLSPQKKYRQPRNYFFSNAAGRIILSTCVISVTTGVPALLICSNASTPRLANTRQSTGLDCIVPSGILRIRKVTKILLADESFRTKKRLNLISQHIRSLLIIYCFAVYILSISSIYLQQHIPQNEK